MLDKSNTEETSSCARRQMRRKQRSYNVVSSNSHLSSASGRMGRTLQWVLGELFRKRAAMLRMQVTMTE